MLVKGNDRINWFFLMEFLLCGIIVIATLLQKSSIASNSFMISFLLLLVYSIGKMIFYKANHYMLLTLLILLGSFINILISSIINNITVGIDYFTEYFIFASTTLFIFDIFNTDVNSITVKFILVFNVFLSYLYPIAYRFFPQKKLFDGLALNFSNPNLTGMWILQSVLYSILAFVIIESWLIKILSAVSVPFNVILINLTYARNCLVALTVFMILCFWITLKKKEKYSKLLIFVINVIPILFVPIYLSYIKIIVNKGWLSFFAREGKSLTSRIYVWSVYIEQIKGLWLTGNYAVASGNAHNSHMVILSSYGLFILALVIYFFYKISMEVNDSSNNKKNLFALSAFFCVIIMGLGEGALFSGGMGIFVTSCGFLIIARNNYNDKSIVGGDDANDWIRLQSL